MNDLGISITVDQVIFDSNIDTKITNTQITNENELEYNLDLKLCRVMTMQKTYLAIDDIFKSEFGRYYIDIYVNGTFVKLDFDLVIDVFNTTVSDSYLVRNWKGLKKRLIRIEKLKRILK